MKGAPQRSVVIVALLALIAASCGQYQNVHRNAVAAGQVAAASGGGSSGTSGSGGSTGLGGLGGGTKSSSSGGGSLTGGATGASSGGGLSSGGSSSSSTGSSGSSSSGGSSSARSAPSSSSGNTTGVTGSTITIGIHAPVTGAAPVQESSFQAGTSLYWKYGNNGGPVKINGRTVHVVFQDDHYNPSYARQVCQQMAQQDHSFLLIGGAGTDQIKACAEYAQSQGIPYLSAGVTESELNSFSTYFAVSATYPYQTKLLDNYIKHTKTTQPSQVAMIAEDTPNFDDSVAQFQKDFPGAKVYRPAKNDNGSSMAPNICAGPTPLYKVVYPLVAPVYYLQMAKATSCHPQYMGVGLTNGIDQVASTGCAANNSTQGAEFFNPSPAWQDRNRFDPSFEKAITAAKKANGGNFPDDDIVWLLWGLSKDVAQLLANAGKNLTRSGFISATEHAKVNTGVYPPLRFSPSDHFGASSVNDLVNVCKSRGNDAGYYVTKYANKNSF